MIEFSRTKDAAALAVGLINTWDTLSRDPEGLPDVAALRRVLRFYERNDLAEAVSPRDAARARDLRTRLRHAFEAEREEEAVELLNEILRRAGGPPQLVGSRGSWSYRYHARDAPPIDVLATTTALALLDVIRAGGGERLGFCAAGPCRCVFVDRSRNRNRRYCCQLCADRAAQSAFRRRRRAGRRL